MKKKTVSIDKRVQRTNIALKDAFRQLAKSHKYSDITVKELTDTAKINRKTFYLHYDSIGDFVNTFADEMAQKLMDIITAESLSEYSNKSGELFDKVVEFFEQSKDFYTFVITSDDYSFLSRRVEHLVCDGLAKVIRESYNISINDAYISASFVIRNALMWFRLDSHKEISISKDEFKDRLIRLNSSGLSTFLKK